MLTLIRGAGDLATGVAIRLKRSGIDVAMTEIVKPSAIRRTVAFSEAVYGKKAKVEEFVAILAEDINSAKAILGNGNIPVLTDESGAVTFSLKPDVLIDAIIAKRNIGTRISDAPIVIALGPGFTVGTDCDAAVETKRGHYMGKVYYEKGQSPIPNTGVPGFVAGFGAERVMHAPCAGIFQCIRKIGDNVKKGEPIAKVGECEISASIDGILRGLLPDGYDTPKSMKCADIDPRCEYKHCFSCSDKAMAMGGAVLEAIMNLSLRKGIDFRR